MELEKILLVWPKTEQIIRISKERDLTSEELLALKSASFYAPIKLLELVRGDKEEKKELYARTAYNILRELDECEDAPNTLTKEDKRWAIGRLSFAIGEVALRDPNGTGIEGVIKGEDIRGVTQKLSQASVDEKVRVFVEHFGRGCVLRDVYNIGKEGEQGRRINERIDYCVKSMATGMTIFLEKGPIETVSQLHTYCKQVAGRIGSLFLNELIRLKDGIKLDDELAEKFGEYLQLTNIIKNIRSDYMESRRFLPGQFIHKGVSYEYMMDGKGPDANEVRNEVFKKMITLVEENFDSSVEYIKCIPESLSGYKAFCLVPLIVAKKTIETMRGSGAERVFNGEEDAIKIGYGIKNILELCSGLVKHEFGKNTNNWLEEFKKNSEDFSFRQNEYEQWASNWIGNIRLEII